HGELVEPWLARAAVLRQAQDEVGGRAAASLQMLASLRTRRSARTEYQEHGCESEVPSSAAAGLGEIGRTLLEKGVEGLLRLRRADEVLVGREFALDAPQG